MLKEVSYEEQREQFLTERLNHNLLLCDTWSKMAEGTEYLSREHEQAAEYGRRASFYRDAIDALKEQEKRKPELEQVKRERDAAIYDLSLNSDCTTCERFRKCHETSAVKCAEFIDAGEPSPIFKWRGVCKENGGGEERETD